MEPTVDLGARAVLTVPGRAEQVSEARAFARRLLGSQHSCVDTVVLLLSEVVTNSVLFFLLSSCVAITG